MVTADWGNGMDINEVSESLQFGSRHTDEGPRSISASSIATTSSPMIPVPLPPVS